MEKQRVDLVVFGANENGEIPDKTTWMALLRLNAATPARNVAEMVSKITILCSKRPREIARLTIVGHANESCFTIGADTIITQTLKQNLGPKLKKEDLRAQFQSLRSFFANDAEILLGGCQVGKTDELVNALSHILPGIRVKAFSAEQRPGLLGYLESQGSAVTSVNGKVVSRTATNGFDTFDCVVHRTIDVVLDKLPASLKGE